MNNEVNVTSNEDLLKKINELELKLIAINENLIKLNEKINENNDFNDKFKGLIEIQQRLIHERLGAPIPAPIPAPTQVASASVTSTNDNSKKISLCKYNDDKFYVKGNTFEYNNLIKLVATENNEKAKWEPAPSKFWILPNNCLNSLIEKFDELNVEYNINIDNSNLQQLSSKKLECEENGFGSNL